VRAATAFPLDYDNGPSAGEQARQSPSWRVRVDLAVLDLDRYSKTPFIRVAIRVTVWRMGPPYSGQTRLANKVWDKHMDKPSKIGRTGPPYSRRTRP
jgi:hypothetical protein